MGLYAPSAGTVYPRLARLEADGLVEHQEDQGRKVYRLTDAGRRLVDAHRQEIDDVEADITRSAKAMAREVRDDVRESVRDLRTELKQAAREARREVRSET